MLSALDEVNIESDAEFASRMHQYLLLPKLADEMGSEIIYESEKMEAEHVIATRTCLTLTYGVA